MTQIFKSLALGMAAAAATLPLSTVAQAQSRGATAPQPSVATVDVDGAVQSSAAFTTAVTQIQTTYAAQIQNRQVRAQVLQQELQALAATAQAEQARTPQNPTALQAAITAYRTRQQAAEQELQTLSQPIDLAVTYVREQITLQLSAAVRTASTARGISLLVNNESVVWRSEAADLTPAVIAELNRLVPNVQIVPPEGYQPGMLLRAQQNNAANGAPAAPATPTPAPPSTR